jgi:hypothetical protein
MGHSQASEVHNHQRILRIVARMFRKPVEILSVMKAGNDQPSPKCPPNCDLENQLDVR